MIPANWQTKSVLRQDAEQLSYFDNVVAANDHPPPMEISNLELTPCVGDSNANTQDEEVDFDNKIEECGLPSEAHQLSNACIVHEHSRIKRPPGTVSARVAKSSRGSYVEDLEQRSTTSCLDTTVTVPPTAAVVPATPEVSAALPTPSQGMSAISPERRITPLRLSTLPALSDKHSEPAETVADADVQSGGLVQSTMRISETMSHGLKVIKDHGGSS